MQVGTSPIDVLKLHVITWGGKAEQYDAFHGLMSKKKNPHSRLWHHEPCVSETSSYTQGAYTFQQPDRVPVRLSRSVCVCVWESPWKRLPNYLLNKYTAVGYTYTAECMHFNLIYARCQYCIDTHKTCTDVAYWIIHSQRGIGLGNKHIGWTSQISSARSTHRFPFSLSCSLPLFCVAESERETVREQSRKQCSTRRDKGLYTDGTTRLNANPAKNRRRIHVGRTKRHGHPSSEFLSSIQRPVALRHSKRLWTGFPFFLFRGTCQTLCQCSAFCIQMHAATFYTYIYISLRLSIQIPFSLFLSPPIVLSSIHSRGIGFGNYRQPIDRSPSPFEFAR